MNNIKTILPPGYVYVSKRVLERAQRNGIIDYVPTPLPLERRIESSKISTQLCLDHNHENAAHIMKTLISLMSEKILEDHCS